VPLYEYECGSCGKRFEVIQKFSDEPLSACKFCGGPATRLVSSPAVHFKGTGWYVTDYARKSTGAAATADGKSKKEGEKPAVAPTETAKESKSSSDASASSAKE
jgi:putative FmdB family regulatory protein